MRRLLMLLAFLAFASPAAAAPKIDRVAVMSAGAQNYAWDGQKANAAAPQHSVVSYDPNKCSKAQDYYCDITLVKLEAAEGTTAKLQFDIFDFSPAAADFDISVYASDAEGTPGDRLGSGGDLSAAGLEETVILDEAAPGYYLVTVSYYFAPDASYKGTIKATGVTPPPASSGPPAAAPPAAPPATSTPPSSTPTPAATTAPPRIYVKSVKRRGRTVTVRLAQPAARAFALTLKDRRGKVIARGRIAKGARSAKLRAKRRVAPGRYRLRVGTAEGPVRLR